MSHRHTPPGTHEHEYEPQHGLPERLPSDERLIWQGSPSAWALARDAFHVRGLCAYFVGLLGLRAWYEWQDTASLAATATAVGWLLPWVAFVLAAVAVGAIASARLAVYTVTSRRVVMRIGIVLTVTYNFPYKQMLGAGLHLRRDGSGDIALQLAPNKQTSHVHLWPHARPWHWLNVQPLMRGLPNAQAVAKQLTHAWALVQRNDDRAFSIGPVAVAASQPASLKGGACTPAPSAAAASAPELAQATA